jgi:hypothetical protein
VPLIRLRSVRPRLVFGVFALLALPSLLAAQQGPAVRDLPKPSSELEDAYSLVASVREVGRGLVVVADAMDGELTTVNFATGERNALGRQGAGPGEYRAPGALFRVRGDTIWAMDPAQQRITVFLPDLKAGVPFHLQMFDTQTRTALMAPFSVDNSGRMYSSTMPVGGNDGGMQIPDSVDVVRFDPRGTGPRTTLSKVRFPTSGKPEMKVEGQTIKYSMAFPGLVTADSWAVFPDGRVAIVHGATYTVEFIGADGKRTTSRPIAYERIPVTKADQEAEMTEAKRMLAEQMKAVRRTMPPGFTLDINMTAPASWPSSYPAIAPMAVHAGPDGLLWVRRSTPARLDREQWDVVDPSGAVVARWRLAPRTKLIGVGAGVVYTVRLDEDDLQYLQRVPVSR